MANWIKFTVLLFISLLSKPPSAQVESVSPYDHISLLSRYPIGSSKGDADPKKAYEWDFSTEDIYLVSRFSLQIGNELRIETTKADIGIGHCNDGATFAVVIPRKYGCLHSSVYGDEEFEHLWLRFHPKELNQLFPDETVVGTGNMTLLARMFQIAHHKKSGSWQAGGKMLIPNRQNLTVDLHMTEDLRRFWVVDNKLSTVRYVSAFEKFVVPELNEISKNLAEKSFDMLWQQYDEAYAMFVLRPEVNWDRLRELYRPQAINSKTSYEFTLICAEMLKHLRDLHIWMKVDGQNIPVFNRPREKNANPLAFETLIGKLNETGDHITWGRTTKKVGFIAIDAWSGNVDENFDEVLENMRDTRGLIIDVRLNGGGNELLAKKVAGRFADKEYIYAYSQYRNGPNHTDLTEKYPRKVEPRGPWRYDRPVVLLMGQKSMSSNESFVSMMAECPQVTTMGDCTCGSSGNPKLIDLPIGIRVSLPRWIDLLPDGTPLDEKGVSPDDYFPTDAACFEGQKDSLLTKAVANLSELPLLIIDESEKAGFNMPQKKIINSEDMSVEDIEKFWKGFNTNNSYWLTPLIPSLSYELLVQEKSRFDAEKGTYSWRDYSSINVWCTPEKNLKFVAKSFVVPRETSVTEEYYFHGHGCKVAPFPSNTRHIREDTWLMGCIGTQFLTSLHLFSWWGLPEHAEVKQYDDILLLCVEKLQTNSRWWKDNNVRPTYGCHPALFPGGYEVPLSSSEIEVDKHSLRPLCIREMDKSGRVLAKIVFSHEWLCKDKKHFPKEIKCYLPKRKATVTYKFDLTDHVWLINETYLSDETDHLSKRSCLKNFDISPIQDVTFDATLPRKSETTLMQGERIVQFETYDGLKLEGKLSVPLKGSSKFPVVFFLPGAGPWTFDRTIEYSAMSGPKGMLPEKKKYNYCDFIAKELTKRGIAFYRTNKRGCAVSETKPYERVNRQIFSKATLSILLKDYEYALNELRNQHDIDKKKIVLLCASEGTVLGPRLGLISPDGILSVVMFGYVEDNTKDIITWQNTVGPWRNISLMFDKNSDKKITEGEYDTVINKIHTPLNLSFRMLDRNRDGIVQPRDLENKATLRNILNAVQKNDDDYLWDNLLNLTSSYLREDWNRGPNHKILLKLEIPIGIFHGKEDGTCRVEGAIETKKAFEEANKRNLTIKTYQKTGHDLNWPSFLRDGQIPNPYQDIFNYIKNILDNKYN